MRPFLEGGALDIQHPQSLEVELRVAEPGLGCALLHQDADEERGVECQAKRVAGSDEARVRGRVDGRLGLGEGAEDQADGQEDVPGRPVSPVQAARQRGCPQEEARDEDLGCRAEQRRGGQGAASSRGHERR